MHASHILPGIFHGGADIEPGTFHRSEIRLSNAMPI